MPPNNILIRVGADTADAVRNLSNVNGPLSDVQTRGEKMGAAIHKATLPAIAALGGLAVAGISAAKAAAEDQAGQASLAASLERTTGATAAQDAAVESWISKLSLATGTADDELRPAMEKLASATGSVSEAQSQVTLALDIAAASHKDLTVVTRALAAADDGHTAALGKLVPGMDAAILKSGDMSKITDELAGKVGGAAATAANTATGRYKIMQVQLGELQESIGTALIPVISAFSAVVLHATTIASEHTTAVKVVIGVVAALAAGVLIANAAMKVYAAGQLAVKAATAAWTAAQWLLDAALSANPVGAVIIAVAALAAGIVIAYKHSETFRDVVNGAFSVLRTIITTYLTPARLAVEGVSAAVQTLIGWISNIHWPSPPSWLGKIGGILGSVAGSAPSAAANVAGRNATRSPLSAAAPRGAGSGGGSLLFGGDGITINVFGATDPEGTARAINRTLRAHRRRQGALLQLSPEAAA